MTCNMARNTEKREKRELHTVGPGIWQENRKMWKMTHRHCLTLNMMRNTQKMWKMRNAHFGTWIMAINRKSMENETQTLYDLEYGEKH